MEHLSQHAATRMQQHGIPRAALERLPLRLTYYV